MFHILKNPRVFLKPLRGFPWKTVLQFNMESKVIYGKFLNIRIFLQIPNSFRPFTTVLRKENNKYNIIPPKSKTPEIKENGRTKLL